MKKHIRVAAAVIVKDGQFLLSLRPDKAHQGGKWEFPGGKIETGEDVKQALARELKEELDITVLHQDKFHFVEYEYPEKIVSLYFRVVDKFEGQERGVEDQEIGWFTKAQMQELTFPDANVSVLNKIIAEL